MNPLVPAVARTASAPTGTARRPIAARAAAHRNEDRPAALDRVTATSANVPATSAFGSAL